MQKTVTFDDIASTVLPLQLTPEVNQSFNHHPIVSEMTKSRRTHGMGDGPIEFTPVLFGDNPSVGFIQSSKQSFTYSGSTVAGKGFIDPAMMVGYYAWSVEDEKRLMNDDVRLANFIDLHKRQLHYTFKRQFARAIYSNGMLDGKPCIKGIKYWVPRQPGALVVGKIDEAKNPWWMSRSRLNCGLWSDNGWNGAQNNFPLHMWINLSDGTETPGFVVSGVGVVLAATKAYGGQVRYMSDETFGKIGAPVFTFMGKKWLMDKDCEYSGLYMLTPEHWEFITATGGDGPDEASFFEAIPPFRIPGQPLMKVHFLWAKFAFACTVRNRQAYLGDWTVPAAL